MKLGFLEGVLTNNGHYKRDDFQYREASLVNVVLFGITGVCGFYLLINILFIRDYYLIPMHALFSLLALIALIYFRKTNNLKIAKHITVLLLFFILVGFLAMARSRYYSFFWIAPFPPVAYFLLGRKKAILVTLLFCGYILLFMILRMHTWEPFVFSYESILNIAGGTFAITLLVSYYERNRKDTEVELKEINAALEDNRNELRLILDTAAEGIYGIDTEGRCTFCNARSLQLLGYEKEEDIIGKNMHAVIHHSLRDGHAVSPDECKILNAIRAGEAISADDEVFWRADGTCIDVEYYSCPKFRNGDITGAVVTFMDISKRKRDEEKVRYLSRHDPLTGLVNRQYFEEQLRNHDNEKYLPLTVVFADLNGLKLTNDIFGHEAGDLLLRKAAGILKKNSRKMDIIARTGGDEFILLLPNTTADEAAEIIERIRADLSGERINAIKCSMSLGFDTKVSMQQDIEQIKKNAEIEMYRGKTLMRKHKGTEMIQDIMNNLHERSARERSHSETISDLCERMGKALHWSSANTRKLSEAGYYHDIGKIVLSDNLLKKTDLDLLEAHEKQQHVIAGYRILNLSDTTLDLAEIVYCHHENWDGSGYPKGLKGEEIPIQSRIIAVAEQYDFMTSSSNPNPCSREEALEKIRINAGVKFDPKVVEVFLKTMSSQE